LWLGAEKNMGVAIVEEANMHSYIRVKMLFWLSKMIWGLEHLLAGDLMEARIKVIKLRLFLGCICKVFMDLHKYLMGKAKWLIVAGLEHL